MGSLPWVCRRPGSLLRLHEAGESSGLPDFSQGPASVAASSATTLKSPRSHERGQTWDPSLQDLQPDKRLLQQQDPKGPEETKINCIMQMGK